MVYTGKSILVFTVILATITATIACGSPPTDQDNTAERTDPTTTVIPTATPIPATPTSIPATPTPEPTHTPTPTKIIVVAPTATIQPEVVQPTATPIPTESVDNDDQQEESSISSPLTGATAEAIAPLQDNLVYLIYFDSRTKSWSVYDNAGTFTMEDLTPILMGQMPDSVSPITTIGSNQPAYVKINADASFMGRDLTAGYNLIVWKP